LHRASLTLHQERHDGSRSGHQENGPCHEKASTQAAPSLTRPCRQVPSLKRPDIDKQQHERQADRHRL
jgi:hypothetical protein